MKRFTIISTALAAGLAILSGCASQQTVVSAAVQEPTATAAQWIPSARQASAMESDGVWVNKKSIEVREQKLPPLFRKPMTMRFDVAMSLSQIAYAISRETGLRVSLAEETRQDAAKPLTMAGQSFDGDLKRVLNSIGAISNTAWRFREGAIEFHRVETRVFDVAAVAGSSSISASVRSVNGSHEAVYTASANIWATIERDLKGMLSPSAQVSVSEAAGTVTVTDTIEGVASAQAYMKQMNERRGKQVAVSVSVYALTPNGSAAGHSAWEAVAKKLGEMGTTERAYLLANGEGSFGLILPASEVAGVHSKRELLGALQPLGRADLVAETSRLVLNGESAPIATRNAGGSSVNMTLAPSVFGASTVNMMAAIEFEGVRKTKASFVEKFSLQAGQTYVFGFRQGKDGASDATTYVVTVTPNVVMAQR